MKAFGAFVLLSIYVGGAYATYTIIDVMDDDPNDRAPAGMVAVALVWFAALPAIGLALLWTDLRDKNRARGG